jgi:N-acylneuraminate cytidylyltransferase
MGLILGVILARGGSKGIPRKNIVKLGGKPLLGYTIDAALGARRLDRVVVSTEDNEIARIAEGYGVEVIVRPVEYATETAPIELALRHTVQEIESKGEQIEIIVSLYGNVPVRKEGIIDQVVEKLMATGADSVQTYTSFTTPPQWAYRIEGDRPSLIDNKYEFAYRRQLLQPAYHPDGAAIALRYETLMQDSRSSDANSFLGSDRRAIVQAPEDTVDVDEPIDLLWAEFLMTRTNT